MARGGIRLNVNFAPLLEEIQRAGGNIDQAAAKVAKESTKIVRDALVSECQASGVPQSLINQIKAETKHDGANRYDCEIGWKKGEYNPKNPSAGYVAAFLNYGTARRTVKLENARVRINGKWHTIGTNRGALVAKGFIKRAKDKAKPQLKKAQEKMLKETLGGLR